MIISYANFSYNVDSTSFRLEDNVNNINVTIPIGAMVDTAITLTESTFTIDFDNQRVIVEGIAGGLSAVQAVVTAIIGDIQSNNPTLPVSVTFPATQNVVITNTPSVNATIVGQPLSVTTTNPFDGGVTLDDTLIDSFGRIRVSEPKTLFDISFNYDIQPEMMGIAVTGAATVSLGANDKVVTVAATAVGNKAVFQSKQYHTYQAGKSLLVKMSGVLTSNLANTGTTRIGYFDDYIDKSTGAINGNGIFFECTAGVVSIVRRTYTSGAQVDNAIPRASWNGDKLDGTGASGVTIDWSKTQIFWIAVQWLGVGSVTCGIAHHGKYIIAHTLHHDNSLTIPYMQTACLPIRWEAITSAGQTAECRAVCGAVESEGGFSMRGKYRSCHNIGSAVAVDAAIVPVLTIRKKAAYNRVTVNPISLCEIGAGTDNVAIMLIRNGTNGSGTYNGITDSAVEYCVGGTGGLVLSGGTTIKTYLNSTDSIDTIITEFEDVIKLWASIAGVSDTLTLAMVKITGGSKNITASMSWQEWY